VEYLGHTIRPGRLHVLEKNLRALRGLRYPETQTQMKSFLGMCGVYRRFVADFAKIAKPLTALTSSKLPKKLPPPSGKETDAFEILRGRLLDAPILALPKRHGHYIVDVDASYEQMGCCLQQQQSDKEYHPVGYYSPALVPAEKNYFATEIEALGVVWAVTYLQPYLEGAEFIVRCDHRALLSVLTSISLNARINRWRLQLSEYNYEIRHEPGKDHKVADALSRLPTEGLDTSPLDEDIPVLAFETRASDVLQEASPEEAPMGALTAREIILGQAEDAFCQARLKELDALSPPDPTCVVLRGPLCARGPPRGRRRRRGTAVPDAWWRRQRRWWPTGWRRGMAGRGGGPAARLGPLEGAYPIRRARHAGPAGGRIGAPERALARPRGRGRRRPTGRHAAGAARCARDGFSPSSVMIASGDLTCMEGIICIGW